MKSFLVLCLLAWLPIKSWGQSQTFYGKAYDKTGQTLLYHEVHRVTLDDKGYNQTVETTYLDKTLKEFATLKSDFKSQLFVPNSTLQDQRLKKTETLRVEGNKAIISVVQGSRVAQEESSNEKTAKNGKSEKVDKQEKTLSLDASFVAGQGFNNFIIKHFDELAKGQEMKVSFVVIPLLDYFKFLAAADKPKDENTFVEFKIQIASMFLKAFADPIFVKYDKKSRGLLEFRGLSNLNNEKDEKQQVWIKYSDSPPLTP